MTSCKIANFYSPPYPPSSSVIIAKTPPPPLQNKNDVISASGLQIRVQHLSAYFGEFFDIGGMIPKKAHVFLLISCKIFVMTFFLLKSKLLGGCILPHPPGICSPEQPCSA